MSTSVLLSLSALAALVPAALAPAGRAAAGEGRGAIYWLLIAVAVGGPVAFVAVQQGGAWRTSIAAALWLAVAVTMVLFTGFAAVSAAARRLTPLLLGYLF